MTIQAKLTIDRVVRVVIAVALVLSVIGVPASVPVAQASAAVQPAIDPKAVAPGEWLRVVVRLRRANVLPRARTFFERGYDRAESR